LQYQAFPWFKSIQEFQGKNGGKNPPLELAKNSINKENCNAENQIKLEWCRLVRGVRTEIIKW
jgi:hypothetical protein